MYRALTKPTVVVTVTIDERHELRCPCGKLLGNRLTGTYETKCPRCQTMVRFTTK